MHHFFITMALAASMIMPAAAQQWSVSVGINVPGYPALEPIPGYPVYYAPRMAANYFFYDGLYWVYTNNGWYASDWYDGPWEWVGQDQVPLFVLRVPVRYFVAAPPVFRNWPGDRAPRWESVWGPQWAQRHRNWSQWDHRAVPALAPLPRYQRSYDKSHYPDTAMRQQLHQQHYHYQPHDAQARQHGQALSRAPRPVTEAAPAHEGHQGHAERPQAPPPGHQPDATRAPPRPEPGATGHGGQANATGSGRPERPARNAEERGKREEHGKHEEHGKAKDDKG